jgi:hypothetical protein
LAHHSRVACQANLKTGGMCGGLAAQTARYFGCVTTELDGKSGHDTSLQGEKSVTRNPKQTQVPNPNLRTG